MKLTDSRVIQLVLDYTSLRERTITEQKYYFQKGFYILLGATGSILLAFIFLTIFNMMFDQLLHPSSVESSLNSSSAFADCNHLGNRDAIHGSHPRDLA